MSDKRTIWKFPLDVADYQRLAMPANADILTVQVQRDNPVLYAMVDPSALTEPRRFVILGTGHVHKADEVGKLAYISTFQLFGGDLVFHVFEEKDDQ